MTGTIEGLRAVVERITHPEPTLSERLTEAGAANGMDGILDTLLAEPDIAHVFSRGELRRIVGMLQGEPSNLTDPPLRGLGVPGVPGRALWTLLNPADVEALRAHLAPGQVWMRVDEIDHVRSQWPRLDTAARVQRELLGAKQGTPGHPRGSKLRSEEQLFLSEHGITAESRPATVARLALQAGLWSEDGEPNPSGDLHRKRATSLLRRSGLR